MSRCCTNILELGCFSSCDTTTFESLITDETGEHTIEVTALGENFNLVTNYESGDAISLNLTYFNENAYLLFKVKKPSGEYLTLTQGDIEYDCFRVKTQIVNELP